MFLFLCPSAFLSGPIFQIRMVSSSLDQGASSPPLILNAFYQNVFVLVFDSTDPFVRKRVPHSPPLKGDICQCSLALYVS